METLSTVIKFVGAGNGGTGGGADAASAATSGVATGDISMLIAGIILAFIGVFAFVAARRYATATTGAHVQANNKFSLPIIAAFAAILLGLTLSVVSATQMRAHADTNDSLQPGGDIIATVDEQTGDVSFSTVDIKNTSENAQEIQEFALDAAEGITTIDNVVWTINIGDTKVFDSKVGDSQAFTDPFTIGAGETAKMSVSVKEMSADLAKSLIDKDVAVGITSYEEIPSVQYYTGSVLHPNDAGTENVGLEGATVKFMNGQTEVDSTTTSDGGKYTFTKASVGTEGTIVVTKPASTSDADDYGYSSDTITVDKTTQTQATAHVGKIKSLAVDLCDYDFDLSKYVKRSTYWCPAFSDSKVNVANIKFYQGDTSGVSTMITPTNVNGYYQMSELANTTGSTADTRMKAKYFAICKAESSLHCYQTVDETWNKTFGNSESEAFPTDKGGTAVAILSTFWTVKVDNVDTPRVKSIATPFKIWSSSDTVYFDGSSDNEKWKTCTSGSVTTPPTVNGFRYSIDKSTTPQSGNGWYETYGGYDGGVLSFWANCPWSAVASSGDYAFTWGALRSGWDVDINRDDHYGVVVSQAFIS